MDKNELLQLLKDNMTIDLTVENINDYYYKPRYVIKATLRFNEECICSDYIDKDMIQDIK